MCAIEKKLDSLPLREAVFIEPMEYTPVQNVPEGPPWIYEIKLDDAAILSPAVV
jgi:hypothetical protein